MDHKTYQPKMPDIMEAVFDAVYLLFDLVAGIVFFAMAQGRPLFVLYGILTLTLCGGDAFHLVPRIFRAFRGSTPKIKHLMGTGLQISSITMTAFYVILLFIWKLTFPGFTAPAAVEVMIWASAIIRIAVCLLPQNNWCTEEGNRKLSVLRNGVFAVTGLGVIVLYAISGNTNGYHMTRMVAAILISFGCYVSLFPQLIAGPIVRYTDVARELEGRTHSMEAFTLGLRRFLFGLGKKVLLANQFGALTTLYRDSKAQSVLYCWLYALAFALQIYFDFSGYSDMAIGLGQIFGFRFPENFNYPYIAASVKDFWHRWHISLSSWLRDYLYIPLGGNRKGIVRKVMNNMIVFLVCGMQGWLLLYVL